MDSETMKQLLTKTASKYGCQHAKLAVCITDHFGGEAKHFRDFFLHVGLVTVYNVRSFDEALAEMDARLASSYGKITPAVCPTCGHEVEERAEPLEYCKGCNCILSLDRKSAYCSDCENAILEDRADGERDERCNAKVTP